MKQMLLQLKLLCVLLVIRLVEVAALAYPVHLCQIWGDVQKLLVQTVLVHIPNGGRLLPTPHAGVYYSHFLHYSSSPLLFPRCESTQ